MKIKTHQKTSTAVPDSENRNVGIMIGCGNCAAIRVFKIDAALEEVMNRQSAGFVIETECEECGHLIAIAIGWINAQKSRYSFRKMELSLTHVVSDEGGLSRKTEA